MPNQTLFAVAFSASRRIQNGEDQMIYPIGFWANDQTHVTGLIQRAVTEAFPYSLNFVRHGASANSTGVTRENIYSSQDEVEIKALVKHLRQVWNQSHPYSQLELPKD